MRHAWEARQARRAAGRQAVGLAGVWGSVPAVAEMQLVFTCIGQLFMAGVAAVGLAVPAAMHA